MFFFFFSVWLCVHIRWLDWPSRNTSLSQALFSKPLSPIGPPQPSRGNVTRRIARWTFQDGHLVSFFFFSFGLFFSYSPILSNLRCLYLVVHYCLSLALCLYLLFLVCCFDYCPTPTPSLFPLQLHLVCDYTVQVATAYRWDAYHTLDTMRIANSSLRG